MTSTVMQWTSAAVTDQGNVRDHNEDSCLDAGDRGIWVVADGMGGHDSGDYASQLIVERLGKLHAAERPSELVNRFEDTLLEVNRLLYEKSMSSERPTVIGSTVAALLAFDRYCVTVWAGDSRVYLLRGNALSMISRDHSEVQNLVDQGLVEPEDAESHPQANVITRAVGGAENLFLDYVLRELSNGDRFLICSDGLFKDVTEREMEQLLGKGTCEESGRELLELALSRECKDNVTVLVIDFNLVESEDDGPTQIPDDIQVGQS